MDTKAHEQKNGKIGRCLINMYMPVLGPLRKEFQKNLQQYAEHHEDPHGFGIRYFIDFG